MSESIIKEIEEKKRRTSKRYEEDFQTLIINKIKYDLRKHDKRESALTLLIETFGDFIHDHEFISFLSSKLDYYPGRSNYLINNTKKDFVPCNSLSNVVLNEAYSFWIKNSIPSTDKRSDRDAIYVSEMKYLQEYKQTLEFEDENISEFANVKRNGNSKTYMRTQHLIYMKKKIENCTQNSYCQGKMFIVLFRRSLNTNHFI